MIKCVLIDDEPLARDVLESYIQELDVLELVGICKDAIEAKELLKEKHVDLIFLDINMPKLSGINFYKTLVNKPQVIFTTAYADNAVEGFELEAIDYLLKPFSFERFVKAVNKVHPAASAKQEDFIMLKADKKNHKINFERISHFESIGDYVKVFLDDGKVLIVGDTLRKLEESLPPTLFMRVHKSFIISIHKLEYIEGNQLMLSGLKIPIGQSYREKVNEVFKK